MELQEESGVHIAVEGCGHGTLNAIYASIDKACEAKGWQGVDLLIIGGDFQVNTLDCRPLYLKRLTHLGSAQCGRPELHGRPGEI